ncbi:MAG: hypothetical protein WD872_12765 [Pirellulaceae bacterium]
MVARFGWKLREITRNSSLLALAMLSGCGRPAAAPTPPAKAKPAPPLAEVSAPPKSDDVVAVAEMEADALPPVAEPAPPTFATERILLLAPRNPLLIEFQLSIDGRPHTAAMDGLVEEVLKLADFDADGRPTWQEVVASKRFKYGQFGNLPIAGENEYKQIIERYDTDRDGAVDAGELPRFLTRNAGSSRAFSVRGTADARYTSRHNSPLWKLLDEDEDGALSSAELGQAPLQVLSRDTDDDEIVQPGDLNPRAALNPAMNNQRRRRGPTLVVRLGENADWDSIRLQLERDYGGNRYLQADAFPLTPELFQHLDADGDGKLLKAEYSALNEASPHLVIAASFGRLREGEAPAELQIREGEARESEAPAEPPPAATLRLVSIAEGLASDTSPVVSPNRLTLHVAGVALTFYVNDTVAGGDFEAQAQQTLTMLDADKNGYLEKTEVPESGATQLGQFEAVDADEDGKAFPAEIAAFLKQQQAGLRAQVHARASDREDALFATLDQNQDERLDAREIDQIAERLMLLDRSGDGLVTGDELAEFLVVGLARGNLENMDALFAPPPLVVQTPAEDTPRWFTAMDGNRDGTISPREFLGPPDTFSTLDTTGDGLIEVAEAKDFAAVP